MDDDLTVVRPTGRQIRVLAHPLRTRLLGALRMDGPATATALARQLDTNTGATSYHLRQLAEAGLVTEDADRGSGRQRFWRAVHDMTSWRSTDFDDDPDARAAAQWIDAAQVRFMTGYAERWLAAQHGASREWRDAATFSDAFLTISPARLAALNDEILQTIRRYRAEAPADDDGAAQVLVFLASFPRTEPGPTTEPGR